MGGARWAFTRRGAPAARVGEGGEGDQKNGGVAETIGVQPDGTAGGLQLVGHLLVRHRWYCLCFRLDDCTPSVCVPASAPVACVVDPCPVAEANSGTTPGEAGLQSRLTVRCAVAGVIAQTRPTQHVRRRA